MPLVNRLGPTVDYSTEYLATSTVNQGDSRANTTCPEASKSVHLTGVTSGRGHLIRKSGRPAKIGTRGIGK